MYVTHFDYRENISLSDLIIFILWLSLLEAALFRVWLRKTTAKFVNHAKTETHFPALKSKLQNASIYSTFSKPIFVIKNT